MFSFIYFAPNPTLEAILLFSFLESAKRFIQLKYFTFIKDHF